MWFHMYELATSTPVVKGMKHYVEMVQQPEFAAAERGYTFVAHQQEVGTGLLGQGTTVIQGGQSSVTALTGSTEEISSTKVMAGVVPTRCPLQPAIQGGQSSVTALTGSTEEDQFPLIANP